MFEKDAEEILNNYCDCELLPECISGIRCRCSDFEEIKKLLLEGIEFGYNKANEWHYVKDELPEKGKYVLGYTKYENVYVARLVKDTYFINKKGGFVQTSDVIAWKEIVLPEQEG